MKAWLAAFIVLTTTHVAAAKRVIMTPTIPRSCPGADSWEKVSTCVSRFGTMRIERELPDAKLISLGSDHYRAPGLYIYALKGKRWQLAGMLETEVTFELESFKRVKLMGHTGFRFDIAFAEPVTVDPDRTGDAASRDFVQQKESVFCAGGSYSCTDIRTSCDLYVNGISRESFRGKLEFRGDIVKVVGDRVRNGQFGYCAVPDEIGLGFSSQNNSDDLLEPQLKGIEID